MRPIACWVCFAVLSLAIIGGLIELPITLGVQGEWEWDRVTLVEPLAVALLLPTIVGALYLGFVWLGSSRIDRGGRIGLSLWLAGLAVGGFAWLWVVQEAAPDNYQLSKAVWVLYFRGSSGYFSEAREEADDLSTYLARYEQKMREGDVLHLGTHPPGLIVAFRVLLSVCQHPVVAKLANATEPESVRTAFVELNQSSRRSKTRVTPADRAVLWLAAIAVQAGVALTVVPLFGLLRLFCSRRSSWLAAAFWPAVPAVAVFCPKSDCLYSLLATGFVYLWLQGLVNRSWLLGILAGAVFWLGMTCSLAMLPVAVIALVSGMCVAGAHACDTSGANQSGTRSKITRLLHMIWPTVAAAAGTFVLACIAVFWICTLNLPAIWRLNLLNHAGFYNAYPRTYWKWLLVNPLEFVIAAGLPLALLAGWSIVRNWRRAGGSCSGITLGWLITFVCLWLSGKNMGEAARLWIFLMPFLACMAGPLFERPGSQLGSLEPTGQDAPTEGWAIALGLQLVSTMAIVTHIAGFHYPQAVPPA
jgi:hypothetical protein